MLTMCTRSTRFVAVIGCQVVRVAAQGISSKELSPASTSRPSCGAALAAVLALVSEPPEVARKGRVCRGTCRDCGARCAATRSEDSSVAGIVPEPFELPAVILRDVGRLGGTACGPGPRPSKCGVAVDSVSRAGVPEFLAPLAMLVERVASLVAGRSPPAKFR